MERREKRQKELDYKIKVNERRLSEKYRQMARDGSSKYAPRSSTIRSREMEEDEPGSKQKSVTINTEQPMVDDVDRKIEENKLKRETLIRKLADYDNLESKKKKRLSEQEKELSHDDSSSSSSFSSKLIVEGVNMLKRESQKEEDDSSKRPSLVVKRSQAPRHFSAEPKRETLVSVILYVCVCVRVCVCVCLK